MVSTSVGTGRGGGACAGAVGSEHLNNASRSAGPTEGAVTAAMTWSTGTNAGSPTEYTGRALSGIGFTILRSSASAWLSHTLHLSTISPDGSFRWNTIEIPPHGTVQVSGNELVTNQPN